ncbi:hypothetical protein RB595_004896 [Gaeumannomyces hyphopodioides]
MRTVANNCILLNGVGLKEEALEYSFLLGYLSIIILGCGVFLGHSLRGGKSDPLASMAESKSITARFGELAGFLASIKGDLSNVTGPTSFLAPKSVVEVGHCWAERPRVFAALAFEDDPARRALAVQRLVLVALRPEVYVAGAPGVSIKKPLNAFLGELFLAGWTDNGDDAAAAASTEPRTDDKKSKETTTTTTTAAATAVPPTTTRTTTRLVAEQVSHHPPITAMHIASAPEHGVRADGYARVEMTFNGSVNIRQVGHAIVRVDKHDEEHLIPLPDVKVRGFLSACLYPEVLGTYHIVSSSGYVSELKFTGAGVLRGRRNSFEARLFHKSDPKKTLFKTAGCWSEGWTVKCGKTGALVERYDVDAPENAPAPMQVADLDDQDHWESRRAWAGVIAGLGAGGDHKAVAAEKTKLEQAQRRMRADELERSEQWEPLLFASSDGADHEPFHRLTEGTDWELHDARTKGVWRLRDDRLAALKKPCRGGLTPLG